MGFHCMLCGLRVHSQFLCPPTLKKVRSACISANGEVIKYHRFNSVVVMDPSVRSPRYMHGLKPG